VPRRRCSWSSERSRTTRRAVFRTAGAAASRAELSSERPTIASAGRGITDNEAASWSAETIRTGDEPDGAAVRHRRWQIARSSFGEAAEKTSVEAVERERAGSSTIPDGNRYLRASAAVERGEGGDPRDVRLPPVSLRDDLADASNEAALSVLDYEVVRAAPVHRPSPDKDVVGAMVTINVAKQAA
jgi:hypothetical protein